MPLSQNHASEIKLEGPLSSIGAPELKTVLLSLDGAPEYCHNHKKPPQIENTPEVCTAGSRVQWSGGTRGSGGRQVAPGGAGGAQATPGAIISDKTAKLRPQTVV